MRRRRASSGHDGPVGTAGLLSCRRGIARWSSYRSRRAPDTELRTQLRDLANARRRFGYRRLFILLRQDGERSGVNRVYRLYREEGLTVRTSGGLGAQPCNARFVIPLRSAVVNARWLFGGFGPRTSFACGRRLRIPGTSSMSRDAGVPGGDP